MCKAFSVGNNQSSVSFTAQSTVILCDVTVLFQAHTLQCLWLVAPSIVEETVASRCTRSHCSLIIHWLAANRCKVAVTVCHRIALLPSPAMGILLLSYLVNIVNMSLAFSLNLCPCPPLPMKSLFEPSRIKRT